MPSTFPGAIDSFTDPLANSSLASPSHSTLHSDINDAVEKVEQYMGLVKVIPTAATNGTINATTGTVTIGNAVSSVTVTCFSSLYDIYLVTMSGGATSASVVDIRVTLGAVATGYYGGRIGTTYAADTVIVQRDNNATAFNYCATGTTTDLQAYLVITGPNLAKPTHIMATQNASTTAGGPFTYSGYEASSTQHTALTFTPGSGTITGGSIRVYGYRN